MDSCFVLVRIHQHGIGVVPMYLAWNPYAYYSVEYFLLLAEIVTLNVMYFLQLCTEARYPVRT